MNKWPDDLFGQQHYLPVFCFCLFICLLKLAVNTRQKPTIFFKEKVHSPAVALIVDALVISSSYTN